jgi:hypothetical protein
LLRFDEAALFLGKHNNQSKSSSLDEFLVQHNKNLKQHSTNTKLWFCWQWQK